MEDPSAAVGLLMMVVGIPWTIAVWKDIFTRGRPDPPLSNEGLAGALLSGADMETAARSASFVGCFAPLLAPASVALGFYLMFFTP